MCITYQTGNNEVVIGREGGILQIPGVESESDGDHRERYEHAAEDGDGSG